MDACSSVGPGRLLPRLARSLARLLQLFVLDSVRAPRHSRLEGTGLGLRSFGKEFENRWEALPGSELVTVGACKKHRFGYEGAPLRARAGGAATARPSPARRRPPVLRPRSPAPRAAPSREHSPSRPHLDPPVPFAPGLRGMLTSAKSANPLAAPGDLRRLGPQPHHAGARTRHGLLRGSPGARPGGPRGLSPSGPIEARGGKGHSLCRFETTHFPRHRARAGARARIGFPCARNRASESPHSTHVSLLPKRN